MRLLLVPLPRPFHELLEPRQEQDVIALYHELIGSGLLKGIRFFGSTLGYRYDGLFKL